MAESANAAEGLPSFLNGRQPQSGPAAVLLRPGGADAFECGLPFEGSELRRVTKKAATRGLKRDHNRTLKSVFKGAALTASRVEPFRTCYGELMSRGLRPELARVTIARRIAALTLSVWKSGEAFDESRSNKQAA